VASFVNIVTASRSVSMVELSCVVQYTRRIHVGKVRPSHTARRIAVRPAYRPVSGPCELVGNDVRSGRGGNNVAILTVCAPKRALTLSAAGRGRQVAAAGRRHRRSSVAAIPVGSAAALGLDSDEPDPRPIKAEPDEARGPVRYTRCRSQPVRQGPNPGYRVKVRKSDLDTTVRATIERSEPNRRPRRRTQQFAAHAVRFHSASCRGDQR